MTSSLIKGPITTKEDFDKALEKNPSKLVVVEFMVPWSELYKFMIPAVNDLAKKYKDYADFHLLDIDKMKEYARQQQVEVLPTFILFRNKVELKRIVGIKKDLLESSIEQHKGQPVAQSTINDEEDPSTTNTCIIL